MPSKMEVLENNKYGVSRCFESLFFQADNGQFSTLTDRNQIQ